MHSSTPRIEINSKRDHAYGNGFTVTIGMLSVLHPGDAMIIMNKFTSN
jgi:hypothetical protein